MDAASRDTSFSSPYESHRDQANAAAKPQAIKAARLPMHHRQSSQAHSAQMRQEIAPWGTLFPTPAGCRAVSYSSWHRFSTASTNSKSSEKLRASVLLEEHGTTPDFDPPLLERCDLRVAEEVVRSNPNTARTLQRSSSGLYIAYRRKYPCIQHAQSTRTSSTSSWTTATSEGNPQPGTSEPITFEKRMVRPASTSSLLTASFKEPVSKPKPAVTPKVALENIKKEFGMKDLSVEDLPEDAFETDSEDED
ncbi:hypothetical protein BU23DRAFT_595434 [Bimuria novae-zelandiae CBS 107.79]|uniref:Uncharacterized protein n=1 Tax=Bimuria novae-zelandiae CBS 107.79 TaxID=1447943 RepID=A0A6A5VNS8_9PLEO|nr:hypothetical protein BU23DRAFT_595434 [Bimuria novae-zelandiae CBS 107.79]